jgi:hypothetical protein
MALNPTKLSDLITLTRQRTNMEVSQFVTDLEITAYLNNSLAMLDTYLANQFNDYKITSTLATITSGTNTFALPADFLRMRGLDVWYDLSTIDGYQVIPEHDFRQRTRKFYLGHNNGSLGPAHLTYRLQGQAVLILPGIIAPNYTYRLWYTPQYIPLVNTSDTLQSFMDGQNWTEYAVVDTAIKILEKQDLDPTTFMNQAAQLKEYIIKLAIQPRNSGEPKSVVDTDRGGMGRDSGFGWSW